jgi:hypothetical protein
MQRMKVRVWLSAFLVLLSLACHQRCLAQVSVTPAWQELGDGPANSSEVASIVVGETLHLVTLHDAGAAGQSYQHRTITSDGTTSSSQTILSGWQGLSYPSLLARSDGSLSVLFFGNRTGNTSDPYSGYSLYRVTSSIDRSTWTLDGAVYDGAPGLAGQSANGGVLYNGNEEVGISIQSGDVRVFNINTATAIQTTSRPCCAYSPTGAVMPSSGELMVGFYSNATDQAGVFFQALLPTAGSLLQAPGAENDTRVRVPLVARGNDLYTAYAYGRFGDGVRVWRVGSSADAYLDIPNSRGAIGVTLASDGSYLWAIWGKADGTTTTYVARSNADATRFGRTITLTGPPNSTAIYNRSGEASRGHLDLFVTSDGPAVGISSLYARIGIPLEVTARPRAVRRSGGVVRLTVTDGDTPVEGVRLRAGGRSAITNSAGGARINLRAGRSSVEVRAVKEGYTPGSVTIRRTSR